MNIKRALGRRLQERLFKEVHSAGKARQGAREPEREWWGGDTCLHSLICRADFSNIREFRTLLSLEAAWQLQALSGMFLYLGKPC